MLYLNFVSKEEAGALAQATAHSGLWLGFWDSHVSLGPVIELQKQRAGL